ncbi:helix-turn-helix domain-containing protein [Nocardia sp. NPDC052566]|uniref:helix-turn-helix domain-containing protein n=1 Tax=Nocardia sp. NPDC052566 TaxID=3364330 RepID=UPI0037C8B34B
MIADLKGHDGRHSTSAPLLESDWQRVGTTLRTLRELRGLPPATLADHLGISRAYLCNIEAGRKRLTNILLARAASVLNVPQIAIMRPNSASAPKARAS